ncbi:hypothetical protein TRFO_36872 [Tritrichomonas foetus]|uniref:Transmembrane 9 superfamily member n=1 Tax=Tritrichomonas foetus TaxID=1144522 RepID=A0A1J4JHL9_9EUKA|nr:hypothetical protein TRFO_36872 [Tritrichomonas foetus]|eukprot:OHS96981.1 hypothetical protein TRFO_36872 [Tritrichomonas foetus]
MLLSFFIFFCYSNEIPIYVGNICSSVDPTIQFDANSFPLCEMKKTESSHNNISFLQRLSGFSLNDMGINARFKNIVALKQLCNRGMTKKNYNDMKNAILKNCWIQFIVNNSQMYTYLGKSENGAILYYSKWMFTFYFTDDQIVSQIVTGTNPLPLIDGEDLQFSYSITWIDANNEDVNTIIKTTKESYSSKYWYHFYSLMMMIIIIFSIISYFAFVILTNISEDYKNFQKETQFDDFDDKSLDFTWKSLHGDVFRKPVKLNILSGFIGSGFHILYTFLFVLIIYILSNFIQFFGKFGFGSIFTIIYVISAAISGFASSAITQLFGESKNNLKSIKNLRSSIIGSLITSFPCWISLFAASLLSDIISPKKCFALLLITLFFISPLATFGGYLGNTSALIETPCDVAIIPRKIPKLPLVLRKAVIFPVIGLICGFLFIHEFSFLFCALMNGDIHWFVTLSLIVLISTIFIIIVSTITMIYGLLQNGYYLWQWYSFLGPFSSSVFVFLFFVSFINSKTSFQTTNDKFAAYLTALSCSYVYGTVCGVVGFISTNAFLQIIYSNLKFS